MGGSIVVESQPGVGSTFRFDVTLRLAAAVLQRRLATSKAPRQGGAAHPAGRDNPTNRLVALSMIERLGHQGDAVGTGPKRSLP